jgi:hypothetical protein
MRVLFGVATVAAVVGMLWGSVTPAHACTCAELPIERHVAEAQLIVLGQVAELRVVPAEAEHQQYSQHRNEVHAIFPVQEYVKGTGPTTLELWAYGLQVYDDQIGIDAVGAVCELVGHRSVGRQYLFYFYAQDSIDTDPGFCGGSFELDAPERHQEVERIRELAFAALPSSGGPPAGAAFPVVAAAAVAVLGPLAFLAGAAFIWPRGTR